MLQFNSFRQKVKDIDNIQSHKGRKAVKESCEVPTFGEDREQTKGSEILGKHNTGFFEHLKKFILFKYS